MAVIHVVIPCYNVDEYIEQAVSSIINQPNGRTDVVLVDDGSPGKTPEKCDELANDFQNVYVVHQKNGGLSSARNAGIEFVLNNLVTPGNREFIAFLDGDDAWLPNVIDEGIIDQFLYEWTEDVIGFSGVTSNTEMTRFSAPVAVTERENASGAELVWDAQHVHLCAKFYSVRIFVDYGLRFQPKQLYTEDRIFIYQYFFLADSARLCSRPLHIYRKNRGGIMSSLAKLSASEHYLPIVDGWMKCDLFLNNRSGITGRQSEGGYALAAVYLVEMVAEHYQKWGKRKVVQQVFNSHPHYLYTKNVDPKNLTEVAYKENRLLFERPRMFEIKHRLAGIVLWVLRNMLKLPFVRRLREKRKFPYLIEDITNT